MTRLTLALLLISIGSARAELLPPVAQPPSILSNFDVNTWLRTSGIPGSAAPDTSGAFRFICNVTKLGRFDPIVYPGEAVAGHMHTFFGNTAIVANSTYESLRASGDSSCQGGPLNRSGYWMPTLMRDDGKAVIPQYISIYYKGQPSSRPAPPAGFGITDHLPRGLRYVFGFDKDQPLAGSRHEWLCFNADNTASSPKRSIREMLEDPVGCKDGGHATVRLASPNCWDGRLDSPNHRDHMAYAGYGSWGYYKCPDTHPRRLPQFTLGASYAYDNAAEIATWYLSSDRMPGMVHERGSTFHSDWFGAWDDGILKIWHDNCIEKLLNCAAFVLGNGTAGKAPTTFTFNQLPRLVDPPADPVVVVVQPPPQPPIVVQPPVVVVPPKSPRWTVVKVKTNVYELRDIGVRPLPSFKFTTAIDVMAATAYLNKVAP